MSEVLFKLKGGAEVPAHELSTRDLEWYAAECKNRTQREAALVECERRKSGAPAPSAAPRTELVRAPDMQLVTGAFRDPTRATDALRQASSMGHLVAPAPICGSIPEGCAMALAAVQVDAGTETYNIGGKLGLSKVALDKIAAAAGISWDVRESRRLDDGSDPRYCHYRAVGRVRDFDGTVRVVSGEVEMDARDTSPLIEEIVTKAKRRTPPSDGSAQILELRKFLLRHAESKAKNRAIRSLGVRTSYTAEELRKPFVVAKVQFTGETNDPELRKMFAEKTADAFLGGQAALYGAPPLASPALPAGDAPHAPPPVGAVGADGGGSIDTEGDDVPPSDPAPPGPPAAAQAPTGDRY